MPTTDTPPRQCICVGHECGVFFASCDCCQRGGHVDEVTQAQEEAMLDYYAERAQEQDRLGREEREEEDDEE